MPQPGEIPPDVQSAIDAADYIVGSDECGYGAWAGPLVVCAVVISKDWPHNAIVCDSKAFSGGKAEDRERARERIAGQILKTTTYAIISISAHEIDEGGIYKILPVAHRRAIDAVIAKHETMGVVGANAVIVDGSLKVTYGNDQLAMSLPKADALIPAVSAASIIGKVARDRTMTKFAATYPGYGFESNKGYGGNAAHDEGLQKLGPCDLHRRSFSPIRDLLRRLEQQPDLSSLGGDDD